MSQTLSTIRTLLAEHGLRPRRQWGQNFLHDSNKMRAILGAAELQSGHTVLEVGPGTGSLTEAMLEAGARVLAVEIDPDLISILRDRLGPDRDGWMLIHADAMAGKHHLSPILTGALREFASPPSQSGPEFKKSPNRTPNHFKLIANLPYNIASPLLATLALDWPAMHKAVVMVQREVADRFTAGPGSKTYGPIGVLLQAVCEVERIATLPPTCFWPKPKIDSAVVKLTRRDAPLTDAPHTLAAFLQRLFSKRRKQIGAILGRETPWPEGVEAAQRPEQLTIAQLIELSNLFHTKSRKDTESATEKESEK